MKFGRKPKLTAHQQREAIRRNAALDCPQLRCQRGDDFEACRSCHWMICTLGMLLVIMAYIFTFDTRALFAFVFRIAYMLTLLTFAPDGGCRMA